MNGEEALKLIDAGFTAEEIRKMSETGDKPDNKDEVESETDKEHESEVTKDINTDFMDSIRKSVDDLAKSVKALQDKAVKETASEGKKGLSAAEVVQSFLEQN